MRLTNPTQTLTAVLAGTPTNAPSFFVAYSSPGGNSAALGTLGATASTVVPAPAVPGQIVNVERLVVNNPDVAAILLTINVTQAGVDYAVWSGTLAVGDTLQYRDYEWSVLDSLGRMKSSQTISLTLADADNLVLGTATGSKIGTGITQKLGFWNAAPVVQPSGANQAALTDSTGGTPTTTLAAITAGASYAQADMVAVKNALSSLAATHNALRNALTTVGLIKGS